MITLVGDNPHNVEANSGGTAYSDPGYSATDAYDGSVTVLVGGDAVSTSSPGNTRSSIMPRIATATRQMRSRTVTVADTQPPVITLNGHLNFQKMRSVLNKIDSNKGKPVMNQGNALLYNNRVSWTEILLQIRREMNL